MNPSLLFPLELTTTSGCPMPLTRLKLATMYFLISTSSVSAGIRDTAILEHGWFVAIDDNSQIWYHPYACVPEDWRYVMNIPGAYLVDGGAGISVVVTHARTIQVGYFRLDLEPWFDLQRDFELRR